MGRFIKLMLVSLTFLAAVGVTWRALIALKPSMRVTSWWRGPSKNREVGGVRGSAHLIGLAWDVAPKNLDHFRYLENLGLKVLPYSAYEDHLHAQFTWSTPFLLVKRAVAPIP